MPGSGFEDIKKKEAGFHSLAVRIRNEEPNRLVGQSGIYISTTCRWSDRPRLVSRFCVQYVYLLILIIDS